MSSGSTRIVYVNAEIAANLLADCSDSETVEDTENGLETTRKMRGRPLRPDFNCPFCGQDMKKSQYLHRHKRKYHSPGEYKCVCQEAFNTLHEMKIHQQSICDKVVLDTVCPTCERDFKYKSKLKTHYIYYPDHRTSRSVYYVNAEIAARLLANCPDSEETDEVENSEIVDDNFEVVENSEPIEEFVEDSEIIEEAVENSVIFEEIIDNSEMIEESVNNSIMIEENDDNLEAMEEFVENSEAIGNISETIRDSEQCIPEQAYSVPMEDSGIIIDSRPVIISQNYFENESIIYPATVLKTVNSNDSDLASDQHLHKKRRGRPLHPNWNCKICGDDLKNSQYLHRHKKKYHSPGDFLCKCQKKFPTLYELKNHHKCCKEVVLGRICPTCNRDFKFKSKLATHFIYYPDHKQIL